LQIYLIEKCGEKMTNTNAATGLFQKLLILRGEKVTLTRTEMIHAKDLYTLVLSPGVLENLTIEVTDLEEFRRYIIYIVNQWKLNHDFTYTILDPTHQTIGQISAYNLNFIHKRGEIGIWIGNSFWGKGFGYDALQTIVKYAFLNLNLNRLQAHIFLSNVQSIALFKKSGFQNEGIIREYVQKDGGARDVLLHSLLRNEWRKPTKENFLQSNH